MFCYGLYHTDDFPQVCCGRHHVDTAQLSPELDLKIAFPAKTVCCFRSFFPQISSKALIACRAFLSFEHILQDQVTAQTLSAKPTQA